MKDKRWKTKGERWKVKVKGETWKVKGERTKHKRKTDKEKTKDYDEDVRRKKRYLFHCLVDAFQKRFFCVRKLVTVKKIINCFKFKLNWNIINFMFTIFEKYLPKLIEFFTSGCWWNLENSHPACENQREMQSWYYTLQIYLFPWFQPRK